MTVEFHLLGPPVLTSAGDVARLHSKKALALLAYLVLEDEVLHSRDKLAALLWGETPEDRARHSLRQSLYSIRNALGEMANSCLQSRAGAVIFRPHPNFWIDVHEFWEHADSQDINLLRAAVHLYRGPLLESVSFEGCPEFEEWLFFRRDAIDQQAFSVLMKLVDRLYGVGDQGEAHGFAQRLVAMNPLHEGAHRRLMRIHAALGDREGLTRQYQLCTEILAREIGVEPAQETQALFKQLATTKKVIADQGEISAAKPAEETPVVLPFVGRENELEVLQTHLEKALAGDGGVVLVAGEAGIGKTSLVLRFIRHSREAVPGKAPPFHWLKGRCYQQESGAPYTVWADLLAPLGSPEWASVLEGLTTVWRQQLGRLVPDLGLAASDIEGATAEESRLRLLQGVVKTILHIARAGTLVLFIDDLHWADEASLELIHYVIRQSSGYPLLILLAYRPEETADNPQLELLLDQVHQITDVKKLILEPLGQDSIERMLEHGLPELPEELHVRLFRFSEGNPLILSETLRSLLESGQLRRGPQGRLIASGVGKLLASERVQELIRARTKALSDDVRRVLAAAAVLGRPFDTRLLRTIGGQTEPELIQVLDQLVKKGFLRERDAPFPEPALDFQHEYIRQSIYEQLGAIQRRALHRRAAEALLAHYRARPDRIIEEVAFHFELAEESRAIPHLVQAAKQAAGLFAFGHAVDLYTRALEALRVHFPDQLDRQFELLLARESVFDSQGRRAKQAEDLAALAELAKNTSDRGLEAEARVRQAGFLAYTGKFEAARRAGEAALDLYRAIGNRDGEAQAMRELGFIHWREEDFGTALNYSRSALDLHRRLGNTEGEASALHNLAEIYRGLGSPRRALSMYEDALNIYWARQAQRAQSLSLYGMAHALRQLGDQAKALDRYRQAIRLAFASGDLLMASRVQHALANLYWESDDRNHAIAHMQKALDISDEIGYGPGIAHGSVALGYFYIQQGDVQAAGECLRDAILWLRLIGDNQGLVDAKAQLAALETGDQERLDLPVDRYWFKSHVTLAEGKVYCEFESPMSRAKGLHRRSAISSG